MKDKIFFNQSKYIKEMLKKFGLEDSKPTKMPMTTEIKLTKDDEADSVDSSKYRETNQPFNLAYFIIRRMYFFRDRRDKVLPYGMILTRLFKNLKANMVQGSFDECYKLIPRKMSLLKAKQPKTSPPKRTRNVGKSKRTQLSSLSSIESSPSDNEDLTSTKISLRSYSRALKDDPNMSKEQRETKGMFKNLG
uniref:Retrovirus-related Pol polyprotein from transposon TNT 1-94 n=1 Tax=Tanacetum cinerariifolium TaxID=118510 RepID=A0A699GYU2_TANCI|nr:retrovirus-related Pol polyprotein from transposon TNT 1-94 [Tanacetum cinerariifolium]